VEKGKQRASLDQKEVMHVDDLNLIVEALHYTTIGESGRLSEINLNLLSSSVVL
jgi:hypothetical protein